MNNLRWTVSPQQQKRLVTLIGAITEESDFKQIVSLEGGEGLSFDLSGVEQINSCGVREWIHFVRKLSEVGRNFEMVRCSPAIVRQLNTIANFRGAGQVRSVMLPYYCPSCRKEELRSLELYSGVAPVIQEEIPCAGCGGIMEFDDIPSTYISF